MNLSEIEASLCFEKIMTSKVLFYDDNFNEDCKKFCKKRNITYLPWKKDTNFCYKLLDDTFKKEMITESQKVDVKDYVFQSSVVEKFREHQVLFVHRKTGIAGVVHFCDYNRNPVSVYGYALLLEFERKLRKILVSNGLNNDDMLDFFLKHNDDRYYLDKAKSFKKAENQAKRKELEPFQTLYLKDLIGLLNFKKIYRVPDAINDNLRAAIMHSQNAVKHKDYENSRLIYSFTSFCEFFELINLLKSESENVSKHIQHKDCDEEVKKLRQAGLFIKL